MMPGWIRISSLLVLAFSGCHCAREPIESGDSDLANSSSSGDASNGSSSSAGGSTGEPFDASRFIGHYHYENPWLPFGERGDPLGTYALVNFEILPDSRATSFYDDCSFEEAVTASYQWVPLEDGWLSLRPPPGETSLRFLGVDEVDELRVQLVEPCRELRFELDGELSTLRFFPGESCWVDRCTTGNEMQVDYCEGEEPEEVCP